MRRCFLIISLLLCMGAAHAQSSDSAIVEVLRQHQFALRRLDKFFERSPTHCSSPAGTSFSVMLEVTSLFRRRSCSWAIFQ